MAIVGLTGTYVHYSSKQWQTMERQLEYSERPWIGLVTATIDGRPDRYSRLKAYLTIQNLGKSPGSKVWVSNMEFGSLDEVDRVFQNCAEKPIDAGVGRLLLPGQQMLEERYSTKLNPATIAYIERRLSAIPDQPISPKLPRVQGIALVGCIDYWWNNRCYRTRFHRQYVPDPQQSSYGILGSSNFGNDTDWSDCPEKKRK